MISVMYFTEISLKFLFDIIVVPSATLLYPAYKCNNKHTVAWVSSVQPECMFHWARGISEISDWNFCRMESAHTCKQCDHCSVSTTFPGFSPTCPQSLSLQGTLGEDPGSKIVDYFILMQRFTECKTQNTRNIYRLLCQSGVRKLYYKQQHGN